MFVAAYDSQLKWCAPIRQELSRRGFGTRVVVPEARSALSEHQIRDAGVDRVERLSWAALIQAAMAGDVVVSALAGPATRRLHIDLADRTAAGDRAPVLVSGWVGVIIEKIVAGYLDRCASDVVAVSSSADLRLFEKVAGRLGLPSENLLLTGLPFLSGAADPERDGPIRRVLFADQPTVPPAAAERRYVYRRLAEYATAHPDREVVLKPRHRPDEDTFHRMRDHPTLVLAEMDTPPNFSIDYTPIAEQLGHTDLLVTMSSTACLEAIDRGCRVALVLDLGVHERYGNQVFVDSGLLRTFSQIGRDDIGSPDPAWRDNYFLGFEASAPQAIAARAEELLVSGERPALAVWQTDYFRSTAAFRREEPPPGERLPRAWRRRIGRHGAVVGSAVHVAHAVAPPVLTRLARTAVRQVTARTAARRRAVRSLAGGG